MHRVSCNEIRDALLNNVSELDAYSEQHLRECESCAQLAKNQHRLGFLLASMTNEQGDARSIDISEIAAAVQGDVERERTWVGRLRALKTPLRVSIVAAVALLPALVFAIKKTDWRMTSAAQALVLVGASAMLLLPLSRPRRYVLSAAVAVLSLSVPALSMWSSSIFHAADHVAGKSAAACFVVGALCSTPAFLVVQLVSRSWIRSWVEVGLLGAIAGIGASTALEPLCASQHIGHLMLGHASLGVAWAVAYALAARVRVAASEP